ncbi:MAG: MBL fold metallo-hydrolase, partial [Duncaniella sp.]|nr:MBL fold metallo-hydrolase [Duncaniella sp.]
DDDNLDLFEAQYPLPTGISYNSYFVDGGSLTAVIDAVDVRRTSDWLQAVAAEVERTGHAPSYLVIQHMEPDHSGSIREALELYPSIKIVCTAKAADMLPDFFSSVDFNDRIVIVKDGDSLPLGDTSLKFITAPMVHWPEVMMTLDERDGVLFSADAFGTFAMSTADTGESWDKEARRYYTNIVGRFGQSVQMLFKKLVNLKFSVIAPLHGPVLTGDLSRYWKLYDLWSRWEPESQGVLVAYASVYGGTAEAARRIAAELAREGVEDVVLFDLCRHDVSYGVAEAFRTAHMVLCSVTYDGMLFPAMYNFLHHLDAKKLQNRRVALVENGSWAPTAARHMADMLAKMKAMTIVEPVLSINSRLHAEDTPVITALSKALMEG